LHALEHHEGETSRLGAVVASSVVACHLRTMARLGVRYDVLPRESDILAHRFWATAFLRLQDSGAIEQVAEGKAAGCWVMNLPHAEDGGPGEEYEKIIVRSNGTVTYVGKDIAYQMWKFGLLGADFEYAPVEGFASTNGEVLWTTIPPGTGSAGAPAFGHAEVVYNVIDVRQAYLQRIVRQGLERLGHTGEAERSIHFSYEMVALTPETALQMQPGLALSDEELRRPWIDMSGRRGIGVRAADLLDRLEEKALAEVGARNTDRDEAGRRELALAIARGALRYYMLRYARNTVVAFDIDGALAFEGETGPYCQYACVRIARIVEKLAERSRTSVAEVEADARNADFAALPAEAAADHWDLVHRAARLPDAIRQAVDTLEFSGLSRFAFDLAQGVSGFYHRYSVLHEPDEAVRRARLAVLLVAGDALRRVLGVMGVPVPDRM
jgi:arginyl-tRNA synthetase